MKDGGGWALPYLLVVALGAIIFAGSYCSIGSALGYIERGGTVVAAHIPDDPKTVMAGHTISVWDLRSRYKEGAPYPRAWVADRAVPLLDIVAAIQGWVDVNIRKGKIVETRVVVHSGYRPPPHNTAVRGKKNSQHLYGRAIDFSLRWRHIGRKKWRVVPVDILWKAVRAVHEHMPINGAGVYWRAGFVHVDIRPLAPGQRPARWGVGR